MKKNLTIGLLTIVSVSLIAFNYYRSGWVNNRREKAIETGELLRGVVNEEQKKMDQWRTLLAEMEVSQKEDTDKKLRKMDSQTHSTSSDSLEIAMQGVWWLLSREDWSKDKQRRVDPTLGADPIGILCYAKNHFSAQFMKRNRSGDSGNQLLHSGQNNTTVVGGYDAYFGTYLVDKETGKVAHTLVGSLTASNIGMTVYRDLQVSNNTLTIQLETTTPEGEPIKRTLVWKRVN